MLLRRDRNAGYSPGEGNTGFRTWQLNMSPPKKQAMPSVYDPSLKLYLPMWLFDSPAFGSRDAFGYVVTRAGALWTPQGYKLDGVDDYLTLGDATTFKWLHGAEDVNAFQFSIFVVYKVTSLAAARTLISTEDTGSAIVGMRIDSQASGGLILVIRHGVGGQSVIIHNTAAAPIAIDNYYCMCCTYDQALASANSRFYVNGRFLESGNKTGNVPSTANSTYALHIGICGDGLTQPTPGAISEVVIYNRAMSQPEINNWYHQARRRMPWLS